MPYATTADFTRYAAPFALNDAAELARILERASRDVDAHLGPWVRRDDGSVFGDPAENPHDLTVPELAALRDATCAQALYRIQNGEDWAMGGGDLYASTSGPDFSVTSKRPRFSPQARQELQGSGLVIRSARLVG